MSEQHLPAANLILQVYEGFGQLDLGAQREFLTHALTTYAARNGGLDPSIAAIASGQPVKEEIAPQAVGAEQTRSFNDRYEPEAGAGRGANTLEKVSEIVGQIEDAAVYGKFNSGTQFQTNNLPGVVIERGDRDDYGVFPQGSQLTRLAFGQVARLSESLKRSGYEQQVLRSRDERSANRSRNHFLMRIPTIDGRAIIDYFFADSYLDKAGRPGVFVHCMFLMSGGGARQLMELVSPPEGSPNAPNPDAAEEFFQQAMPGFEKPYDGDRHSPGAGRLRSTDLVVVDYEILKPGLRVLSPSERSVPGVGSERQRILDAFRQAAQVLPYRKPHGEW